MTAGGFALLLAGRAAASEDVQAFAVQARLPGVGTTQPIALATLARPNAQVAGIRFPPQTGELLSTGLLTASVTQDAVAGKESARAQIANVQAGALGLGLSAQAITATCDATIGGRTTGAAQLTNATIQGRSLPANPAANTVLNFPSSSASAPQFSVTLNEQIKAAKRKLTVNAIHVRWAGGAELILGSARCGACPPPKPPPVPLASGPGLYLGLGASALTAAGLMRKRRRGARVAA
ncbi:hypothetical protein J5X84_08355 [Streptosporangiaceae bacterium NEAU-GS5]|nr:hypothetical protein [Streptosporangiaceae bacterium NEAU-GS5]